jgi:hypothetical protein
MWGKATNDPNLTAQSQMEKLARKVQKKLCSVSPFVEDMRYGSSGRRCQFLLARKFQISGTGKPG